MAITGDFTTPGFSIRTAYYLAKVSAATYETDPTTAEAELGMTGRAAAFVLGELAGFSAALEGALVVAFRGTDNFANWLTDGQVVQVHDDPYPGKVHRGFATALAQLWPGVLEKLPPPGTVPVWVTGHSLGGALATLAAIRLENAGYTVRAVYTFGSPRVGNLDFYHDYEPVNYRFVNNDDVVPHVPLETLIVGVPASGIFHFVYKHVGTLEYLDRHGHLSQGMSDWVAKKDFILHALLRNGGSPWPQAVEDHHIANYVSAIGTNLPPS